MGTSRGSAPTTPTSSVARPSRWPDTDARDEAPGARICRVRPDVAALDRAFDYIVPDALRDIVRVGSIVRVSLHGRRVRGWVVADDVEPATAPDRLRPLLAAVSDGPPADVVALCAWGAWRWAGPSSALLGAASAPNIVAPGPTPEPLVAVHPPFEGDGVVGALTSAATGRSAAVVRWPPTTDRRALVTGLLAEEGSTIVVVPDGGRLGALVDLLTRSGRDPVVLRADRSAADRTRAWSRARRGACVVVGGRLAVLAPVPDLAAIIVLDEGDEALQEERAPTWHARELALERTRRTGARITLVSPTPTIDAIEAGGPPLVAPRDVERRGWPPVVVVDLRDERPGAGLLTDILVESVRTTVDAGSRAVCVLNRRGRARLLACATCRELARCETCDAAVHEEDDGAGSRLLACPRCTTVRPVVCVHCHGTHLKVLRPGVARLRDELADLLPRVAVAQVDAATADSPSADVWVGTEAVLHRVGPLRDRPVGLVAVLDLDQELLASRVRASEQALWLLARAARVVGSHTRGRGTSGRLLVQTRLPDHEVVAAVRAGDPTSVTTRERERRAALGWPPFGGLAELSGAAAAVDAAADGLRADVRLVVMGPLDAGGSRRALVRASSAIVLADALSAARDVLGSAREQGRLRVAVDPSRV